MRKNYGLNAMQMSKILGLGVNMIRNYEMGEMPSMSNAVLLKLIRNPENFRTQFLHRYETYGISEKKKNEVLKNIENLKNKQHDSCLPLVEVPNEYTGYQLPDFEKLSHMLLFFLSKDDSMFKIKLNTCLFFADFQNFKETGKSISGTQYQTLRKAFLPVKHLHIYAAMVDHGYLEITTRLSKEFNQEIEKLQPAKAFNKSIFSEKELNSLKYVSDNINKINLKEKLAGTIKSDDTRLSYQKHAFYLE